MTTVSSVTAATAGVPDEVPDADRERPTQPGLSTYFVDAPIQHPDFLVVLRPNVHASNAGYPHKGPGSTVRQHMREREACNAHSVAPCGLLEGLLHCRRLHHSFGRSIHSRSHSGSPSQSNNLKVCGLSRCPTPMYHTFCCRSMLFCNKTHLRNP